jgi:pyruvate/2-oxoglutarate dehydrogenase complex dihydrolipoamide acyltransferase (E2) component
MTDNNDYTIVRFPSSRQFTMDVGRIGSRKHHVKAFIDIDVTDARVKIRRARLKRGTRLSFTSWVLKCISQAIVEHKSVQALRKGRSKLLVFDHVDISLVVEKKLGSVPVPLPLVIRNADAKSMGEIFDEIEQAKQQEAQDGKDYVLGSGKASGAAALFAFLPRWLRLLAWNMALSNPLRVKRMMGTVIVTSIGMMGRASGWFLPYSIHPLCFALGSIVKKPGVIKERIRAREYLAMTILMDHDVIDGAPAARFVSRLVELMEQGHGL